MEGETKEKTINETTPRFEQTSNGVSFREIALNKEAHKKNNKRNYDQLARLKHNRTDDWAMIVVSALLGIFAILFFFLSFRYNTLKERIFVPNSLPFVLFITCTALGLGLFAWAMIRLIIHIAQIKQFYRLKGESISFHVRRGENYTGQFKSSSEGREFLQFEIFEQPSQGTVELSDNGTFTYKPFGHGLDSDHFSVKASNEDTYTVLTARVTINSID